MAPKAADPPRVTISEHPSGDLPASPKLESPTSAKPEDYELARKLEEQALLEAELAERELRAANLRAELGAFERQYLHFVGSRYAELDEWRARLAEHVAHHRPGNDRAEQAASEARARAEETRSAAGEKCSEEPQAFAATPEMKRLYREVAKRVHPDLTSDRSDRTKRQQLMADANRAYECGDQQRLLKILTEYEHSPEAVEGEGPGAELVRVIRRVSQARSRLAEIEAETQELLRSDLHQLKLRVDEAEKGGHDILKQMTDRVDQEIAAVKCALELHRERSR
jgi:hypothetical protein